MKKFILGIGLISTICFAEPYLKEGIKAGEDIKNIDLSSFNKVDKNKYKISFGEVYEREVTYKNKTMKEVYSFQQNKLSMIFKFDDTDTDFPNNEIEETGNIKFLTGYVKSEEKENKFSYQEKEEFYGMLNVYLDELKIGLVKKITANTTYAKEIKNDKSEFDTEKYVGISVLKSCVPKEKHKECKTCEFIEKSENTYSCETLYINHVLK